MADDGARKDIGGLWSHESKKGDRYLSGTVEINGVKHDIVIFKNGFKRAENQPDYKIYPSEKKAPKADDAPVMDIPPF